MIWLCSYNGTIENKIWRKYLRIYINFLSHLKININCGECWWWFVGRWSSAGSWRVRLRFKWIVQKPLLTYFRHTYLTPPWLRKADWRKVSVLAGHEDDDPDPVLPGHGGAGREVGQNEGRPAPRPAQLARGREKRKLGQGDQPSCIVKLSW